MAEHKSELLHHKERWEFKHVLPDGYVLDGWYITDKMLEETSLETLLLLIYLRQKGMLEEAYEYMQDNLC